MATPIGHAHPLLYQAIPLLKTTLGENTTPTKKAQKELSQTRLLQIGETKT